MSASNLATIPRRIGAALIDVVICIVPATLLLIIFNGVVKNPSSFDASMIAGTNKVMGMFFGLIVDMFYTITLTASALHSTLGQRIFGIRLAKLNGTKVTFETALIRYFVSLISSLLLKLGFLIAIFTEQKQTLHDLVAGTIVVNENAIVDVEILDKFWEQASIELQSSKNEAAWAKAFANSEGNEAKARAMYIKLRARSFQKESHALSDEAIGIKPIQENIVIAKLRALCNYFTPVGVISLAGILCFVLYSVQWTPSSRQKSV